MYNDVKGCFMNKAIVAIIFFLSTVTLSQSFECVAHCSNVDIQENSITIEKLGGEGITYLWTTEEMYNLQEMGSEVNVSFEAYITGDQEVIIGFSQNLLYWGEDNADALTFAIRGKYIEGFTAAIRTNVFKDFLAFNDDDFLGIGQWRSVSVNLSSRSANLYLDGELILSTRLDDGNIPLVGAIGILAYDIEQAPSVGNVSYRNFSVSNKKQLF